MCYTSVTLAGRTNSKKNFLWNGYRQERKMIGISVHHFLKFYNSGQNFEHHVIFRKLNNINSGSNFEDEFRPSFLLVHVHFFVYEK